MYPEVTAVALCGHNFRLCMLFSLIFFILSMYGSNWGKSPTGPNETELSNGSELVLQSWGFCKARKHPSQIHKTAEEEKQRKSSLKWRKRMSFLELDCGDDSFMVSNSYKTIGIADGVGDTSRQDMNAAALANKLMENSKLYSETHRECQDSHQILSEAWSKILSNKEVPSGSTTACVASLLQTGNPSAKQRSGLLDVINIGNSNAMLIRNRAMLHRAREKMHEFNAPFQLAVPSAPNKNFNDTLADAVREQWEVKEGDVVVLGTDGLFDNVFNSEISEIAGSMGRYEVKQDIFSYIPAIGETIRSWLGLYDKADLSLIDPYKITKKLTMIAYERAYNEHVSTPFSYMLSAFLNEKRLGGKPDDITVLVSRIVRRDELKRLEMW